MPSREERLVQNEILFRSVNERIIELSDRWGGNLDLVCECADATCAAPLSTTLQEYAKLRSDPHQFAVRPGHEIPEIEDVVEQNDRFLIVRKHEELQDRVEEANPRLA
jgi:hypothetical protein